MSSSLEDALEFPPFSEETLVAASQQGGGGGGRASLLNPIRPTLSGLTWLAVPSRCTGLAYRVVASSGAGTAGGSSSCELQLIRVASSAVDGGGNSSVSIAARADLPAPAVNVAASSDGRIVAAALSDGSISCYDCTGGVGGSTAAALNLRWKLDGAHSHSASSVQQQVPSTSRSNAAGSAGPVRSLSFAPNSYALALVDDSHGGGNTAEAGAGGGGGLSIFQADVTDGKLALRCKLQHMRVSSCAWRPSFSSNGVDKKLMLAVGSTDGSINFYSYDEAKAALSPLSHAPFAGDKDGGVDGGAGGGTWSCTHLDWFTPTQLAAGYARVEIEAEEEDEEDVDDAHRHEAQLVLLQLDDGALSGSPKVKESKPMGDVVSFFSVPKNGRHVYFTASLGDGAAGGFGDGPHPPQLLWVTSNVATDVAVLARSDGDGGWELLDLPEGNAIATPTDDDDEFVYPLGLCLVHVATGGGAGGGGVPNATMPVLLLQCTDGSLVSHRVSYQDDESMFVSRVDGDAKSRSATDLPATAVPENAAVTGAASPPAAPGASSNLTPAAAAAAAAPATTTSKPFGSGGGGLFGSLSSSSTAVPAFGGGGSSFGFGSSSTAAPTPFTSSSTMVPAPAPTPFGQPPDEASKKDAGATDAAKAPPSTPPFGASAFGSGAAAPSFGSGSAAPLFGSGAAAPSFGSGSAAPLFGSGKTTPSFGASAASSATPSLFGMPSSAAAGASGTSSGFGFGAKAALGSALGGMPQKSAPFNIFEKSDSEKSSPVLSMAKPLFGPSAATPSPPPAAPPKDDASKKEEGELRSKTSPSGDAAAAAATPNAADISEGDKASEPEPSQPKQQSTTTTAALSKKAQRAAGVFDSMDESNNGKLPVSALEDLLDELGEGFYGAEKAAQMGKINKNKTEEVARQDFIDWYERLGEDQSDADDDSDDDAEDRKEEEDNARKAFMRMAQQEASGQHSINASQFAGLFESMGSVYCEEDHGKAIKKLQKNGKIYCDDFTAWYVDYIFDTDNEDYDIEEEQVLEAQKGTSTISSEGWGDAFKKDEDSWKCESCMVSNKKDAIKCAACETPRAGFEEAVAAEAAAAAAAASAASPTGDGAASGSIGPQGFTFGAALATTAAPGGIGSASLSGSATAATASKPTGGFSFGAPVAATTSGGGSGFAFDAPDASKTMSSGGGGFSFGGSSATQAPPTFGSSSERVGTTGDQQGGTAIASTTDSSYAAKKASRAFDSLDSDKKGKLPTSMMETLMDEVGEGFHGEQLTAQLAKIDKDGTGQVLRQSFIDWYEHLGEASSDDDDSDEEERKEEEDKARKAFMTLAKQESGQCSIPLAKFAELFGSMGTTYCEEEHGKAAKKMQKNGRILLDDFVKWYVSYIFSDDDDDDESLDDHQQERELVPPRDQGEASTSAGWGGAFKKEEGSWKCESCMVSNKRDTFKCAACETPRPGHEEQKNESTPDAGESSGAAPGSGIGPSGFTFGPAATNSGSLSGGVFAAPTTSSSGFSGGFSFGAASKPETGGVGGFSFGAGSASKASAGFSAEPAKVALKVDEATPPKAEKGAYPPLDSTAPRPFSYESKPAAARSSEPSTAASKSSSSAQAPLNATAPTPFSFGASTEAPSKAKELSTPSRTKALSSYPPLDAKTPEPFGSAPSVATDAAAGPPKASIASDTKGSSSPYPPLNLKAPAPFSFAAPKPVEASTGTTVSSYPPLKAQAPKPFGSESKPAAAKPVEASSKTATSSYPPLNAQAPKPFGSESKPAAAKPIEASSKAATSSYPPLNAQAPKPFGSESKPVATKTTSASSYPPLNVQAPKPFGSESKLAAAKPAEERSAQKTSAVFLPSQATAPKPFAFAASSTTTTKPKETATAPASSSYPPLDTKAPTPFSFTASSTTAAKPKEASPARSSVPSSAYPPLQATAPRPFAFGGSSAPKAMEKTTAMSSTSAPPPSYSRPDDASASKTFGLGASSGVPSRPSAGATSTRPPPSTPSASPSSSEKVSDCARHFASLTKKLKETLKLLESCGTDPQNEIPQPDVESLVSSVQSAFVSLAQLDASLSQCKECTATILRKRAESNRQQMDTRRLVDLILANNATADNEFIRSSPLDAISEERRRQLVSICQLADRHVRLLRDRAAVFEHFGDQDGEKAVLLSILRNYQDVKGFHEEARRLISRVNNILDGTKKKTVRSRRPPDLSVRDSEKSTAITEHGSRALTQRRRRQTIGQKWSEVEASFAKVRPATTVAFNLDSSIADGFSPKVKQPKPRATPKPAPRPKPLFSPQSQLKVRVDWDKLSNVDQSAVRQSSSFAPPRELKQTSFVEASREALKPFGTTPEKVNELLATTKQGVTPSKPQPPAANRSVPREIGANIPGKSALLNMPTQPPPPEKVDQQPRTAAPALANPLEKSKDTGENKKKSNEVETRASGSLAEGVSGLGKPQDSRKAAETPKVLDNLGGTTGVLGRKPAGDTSETTKALDSLSGMSGLGNSLFSLNAAPPAPSKPFGESQPPAPLTTGTPKDYSDILTKFYQTHNPQKVSEVAKTLEKYNGREAEMFAKLSRKYGVPNPLEDSTKGMASAPPQLGIGSSPSPFASDSTKPPAFAPAAASPFTKTSSTPTNASPFSATATSTPTPFSASQAPAAPSFGSSLATPASSSPFGQQSSTPAPTPFSTGGMQSSSAFGGMQSQPAATTLAPGTGPSFGGQSAREKLVSFYQQKNPSKVAEVDRLLAKYQGNERQMFLNLAKKYNLDPSVFGVSATPTFGSTPTPGSGFGGSLSSATPGGGTTGFGRPSPLGGGPTFGGSTSSPFGSGFGQRGGGFGGAAASTPSPAGFGGASGSSGFGAAAAAAPSPGFGASAGSGGFGSPASGGGPSFGALAQSSGGFGGGFGSPAPAPFGTATPFGAPRR